MRRTHAQGRTAQCAALQQLLHRCAGRYRTFFDAPDARHRTYPQLHATADGLALKRASWRCNFVGSHRSSSSRKAVHSPRHSRNPSFRAPAPPMAAELRTTLTRLSRFSRASRYAPVPSCEASSMIINSKSVSDWPSTDSAACSRRAALLWVGSTTLTRGLCVIRVGGISTSVPGEPGKPGRKICRQLNTPAQTNAQARHGVSIRARDVAGDDFREQ